MIFLNDSSWEVRDTIDKGKGLFTKKKIAPGTIIGDYTGKVIHPMNADIYEKGEHFYLMYYHDYASIFPDISKPDIYLINHSCTPNCWMYTYKGHTLFFALRRIFPGEEITISYLLSPQTSFCNPCSHSCRCKGVMCNQTMHLSPERYTSLKKATRILGRQTKRERIRIGTDLPLLSSYPNAIADHPIYTLFGNPEKKAKILTTKKLPSIELLRNHIRTSGKTLQFPNLRLSVLGIIEHTIISFPY